MMLTIHGLPQSVKYHDLKSLIKERCNITDYILDNLVAEGDGTKKVRIGLADESEGAQLMKSLNGCRLMGNILRVVPIGKSQPSNPSNYNQQGGYPSGNEYPNQSGPNYGNNRPMDMDRQNMRPEPRQEAWGQGDNQWGQRPNQGGPGGNQMGMQQNNFNNYQPQGARPHGMNSSYGQQGPGSVQRDTRSFDIQDQYGGAVRSGAPQNQAYGSYQPKQDIADTGPLTVPARRPDVRSHVLRSVELVDEPIQRPLQSRYPNSGPGPGNYDQQKPITIMKDNFQGPQYNVDQGPYQGPQGRGPRDPHEHTSPQWKSVGSTPAQVSPWAQNERVPMGKPSPNFDRKFPDKGPVMGKLVVDPARNLDYKGYDKPGPRFSPRRDVADPHLRRPSPGRRIPSPGNRMISPGRRMPSPGRRMPSPGRRMPSPGRRMPSPGRRMPSPGRHVPSPGRRMPSPGRRMPSPGRRMPSPGRRMPSPGRRVPSPGRQMPSLDRPIPPGGRRISPGPRVVSPGRRMPSPVRRMGSPGRRMPSPVRRMPSPGRRLPSPGRRLPSPGRRMPSPGLRMPSPGRRMPSPGHRMASPGKRISPGRRMSPGRGPLRRPPSPGIGKRLSPGRYSPSRPTVVDKYEERLKDVRPAYDSAQASNQAMYTGGYRGSVQGSVEYAGRPAPWAERDKFGKIEEERRDVRMPVFEPRVEKDGKLRKSRSPPRDRFKKHSPSRSPRRSWALEKRRSPDAPPPPMWPGAAPGPVWEPRRDESPPPRYDRRDSPPRFEGRRSREEIRPDFHREEKLVKIPDLNIDDVYHRALEFKKRAEEIRKRSERHRDSREPDERRRERSRSRERHDFAREKPPERYTDAVKAKRDKATSELAAKIVKKHGEQFQGEMKARVLEEVKLSVGKKLQEMFGYADVSFIEMVIKFNTKYEGSGERQLLQDVLASLPAHYRILKRPADDEDSGPPAKKTEKPTAVPEWKPHDLTAGVQLVNIAPPAVQIPNPGLMSYTMQQQQLQQQQLQQQQMQQQMMQQHQMQQHVMQQMMMTPYYATNIEEPMLQTMVQQAEPVETKEFHQPAHKDSGEINLYLCKDDFEPFSSNQVEYLKKFLVSQLVNYSGDKSWSPDFTVKGLQSMIRYEVVARDEATKQWLLGLDFGEFDLFNVLVYTKEELWYERAAVWLPGHSRFRQLEPLEKLRLQNARLHGVNIEKWKLVKNIVTAKGTRVYVDMPPSSARALEKHKMLLSYELQKVSVFLKAVAVDKEAFDMGLREPSIKDQAEIINAVNNSPMPSIANDSKLIKMCLKGNKALNLSQARKVKETIIYKIFKYHQQYKDAALRTDFLSFGYCLPGHFCVLPEHDDSAHWLKSLDIGKLNRHEVVILGRDGPSEKFIRMQILLRHEASTCTALVVERLRQSNRGVKGLNFKLWKNMKCRKSIKGYKGVYEVDMDIESVETILKLENKLDYAPGVGRQALEYTAKVVYLYEHGDSNEKLKEILKKHSKAGQDSYDVANMDIASSDDDDLVFMGETMNKK